MRHTSHADGSRRSFNRRARRPRIPTYSADSLNRRHAAGAMASVRPMRWSPQGRPRRAGRSGSIPRNTLAARGPAMAHRRAGCAMGEAIGYGRDLARLTISGRKRTAHRSGRCASMGRAHRLGERAKRREGELRQRVLLRERQTRASGGPMRTTHASSREAVWTARANVPRALLCAASIRRTGSDSQQLALWAAFTPKGPVWQLPSCRPKYRPGARKKSRGISGCGLKQPKSSKPAGMAHVD